MQYHRDLGARTWEHTRQLYGGRASEKRYHSNYNEFYARRGRSAINGKAQTKAGIHQNSQQYGLAQETVTWLDKDKIMESNPSKPSTQQWAYKLDTVG